MQIWPPFLAILLLSGQAVAQSITEQDAAKVTSAAMFFAMGAIAFGECGKVGYRVNPNGWSALVLDAAPAGVTVNDFAIGARFADSGRAALSYVGAVQAEAGTTAWCTYMAAWAKVTHPRIWERLISL